MLKLLVYYSSKYFSNIEECDIWEGDSLILEVDNCIDIELSIENWFRNTYYKEDKLETISFIIKDITAVYEEFIETSEFDCKYKILLKQLEGHKSFIKIKR